MRFHSEHPNFSLSAPAFGVSIRFSDGYYETEDKTEIRLLSEQSSVSVADTKDELYETAADLDIEGRSTMVKDELAAEVIAETVPERSELE